MISVEIFWTSVGQVQAYAPASFIQFTKWGSTDWNTLWFANEVPQRWAAENAHPAAASDLKAQNLGTLSISSPTFMFGHFFVASYAAGLPGSVPVAATLATHTPSGKTFLFGRTQVDIDLLEAKLKSLLTKSRPLIRPLQVASISSSQSAVAYAAQVEQVRQAILAGDLFQANLSREITVELPGATRADVLSFAERLLTQTQAPFGAIIQTPTQTIISVSPERFFRAEPTESGLKIIAEPIKGTRPRGMTPELDAALAAELLASEKDLAENTMIVDLVRNDLSRVCTDESVSVERLCELRSFARVHHLVSTVSGILRPGLTARDALNAQFPCGSITGAPKAAAMDLIADLEQRERGIYCGAIGFLDDRGHADFSVAIRTATVDYHAAGATLRYGVGGGITVLSDPDAEYRETEDKAADFLAALQP